MKIGVLKSTRPGERRVALAPESCAKLTKSGLEVLVERDAGVASSFPDATYEAAGAGIAAGAADLFGAADVLLMVHAPSEEQVGRMRHGVVLVSLLNPLSHHDLVKALAARQVSAFALELVPRITRAQKMDVLSAMSTVAGYKAVLLAATTLGKMFPLMMTAAGTITPARVLVLGAGVAGLQAIATSRRLGAVVEAFDVRPVVKEQVESLGARFVEVPAPAVDAQDKGGYAKEMSAEYKAKQAEVLAERVREADVVISTALIPGKRAPVLLTEPMVRAMKPGSVIVDLSAEAGGNCALTKPDETVVVDGLTILGPTNLPATIPYHASQMYSRNVTALVQHFVSKEGALNLDMSDEITRETLATHAGEVVSPRLRESMGLAPVTVAEQPALAHA